MVVQSVQDEQTIFHAQILPQTYTNVTKQENMKERERYIEDWKRVKLDQQTMLKLRTPHSTENHPFQMSFHSFIHSFHRRHGKQNILLASLTEVVFYAPSNGALHFLREHMRKQKLVNGKTVSQHFQNMFESFIH